MCAIPVGQAVTANTYGSLDCLDDCSAVATCCASASASSSFVTSSSASSMIASTSSGDEACNNFSRTFSSIKIPDNLAKASRCVWAPPSGAAIIKNKCAGCISKL